jgi:16S rRNA (guanine527-N7)-methyltransferase
MDSLWTELFRRADVELSTGQIEHLSGYVDLLLAANQKFNLTRISDPAEARVRHVGDALTVLPFLPRGAHRLADVGSGGGVPGLPLAIARPDVQVVLIESTKKKAGFLTETVQALGLKNVRVIADRAETVAKGSFDVVVARALANMDQLASWCLPLVRPGGMLLAMKGPKVAKELPQAAATIRRLGGTKPTLHPVELPGATGHVIVQIRHK